jgi:hypothetical protein
VVEKLNMNLHTHNSAELPLIEEMERNEIHLLNEAFANLDMADPDVQAAIRDRLVDLTIQEGQRMARLVD